MKHITAAVLLALCPLCTMAQKNNVFADLGLSLKGSSLTCNYSLTKHFGMGGGMQAYRYSSSSLPGGLNSYYTPAIYVDARGYLPRKKSLFFVLGDIGIDLYTSYIYGYSHDNGLYTGLGLGYQRHITKHGAGPYISLKLLSDRYTTKQYNTINKYTEHSTYIDATSVISLGYKF